MYKIYRHLLYLLSPELAHRAGLHVLGHIGFLHRLKLWPRPRWADHPSLSIDTPFGKISSPLGVAAGFDKNAQALWGWQALGFSFVEVGTVTPLAQPGNHEPRLFRFVGVKALINRMGFNNDGAQKIAERIKRAKAQGLKIKVGGNIGKNLETPLDKAVNDYRIAAIQLGRAVDYFVLNVSSPNTPGLRALQEKSNLELLAENVLEVSGGKPIFIKIAPDEFEKFIDTVLSVVEKFKLAGVICANTLANPATCTTLPAETIATFPQGGLSGRPVFEVNLNVAQKYLQKNPGLFCIGVGGITGPKEARSYINVGCKLIQVYTALVFEGPGLIKKICKNLVKQP